MMLFRNEWVAKWQKRFNHAVGGYCIDQVKNNWENREELIREESYTQYPKMFLTFWVWDYKRFVQDDKVHKFLNIKLK